MNISKSRQRRRQRHRPCVCVCASEWKQSEIGIVWLAILSLLLLLPPPSPYTINLSSFKSPRLAERKTFSKSVGRRKFPYASQHSRWGVDGGWIEKRKQADQEPLKKRKKKKKEVKNKERRARVPNWISVLGRLIHLFLAWPLTLGSVGCWESARRWNWSNALFPHQSRRYSNLSKKT